jgi:GTPase SAR1 family protein
LQDLISREHKMSSTMDNIRSKNNVVRYGQVVVGGPGSGKTTYCDGMQQYLRAIGRPCFVVNFDPANEVTPQSASHREREQQEVSQKEHDSDADKNVTCLPYDAILDVCDEVVHLSAVMEELDLGPNGGLVYCMEYLERHKEEVLNLLLTRLEEKEQEQQQPYYVLFDFPGQVELYTHNNCVQTLCQYLMDATIGGNFRLTAIQLTDSLQCLEPSKFISSVLLSATSMLRLELPTVNVLSKVDLMGQYTEQSGNSLIFGIDFFTNVLDLTQLLAFLDGGSGTMEAENGDGDYFADDPDYQRVRQKKNNSPFNRKHRKLHEQLCDVIDDFSLVSFVPLNIQDAESVGRVVAQADKCNGCAFVPPKNASGGGAFMYDVSPERLFQSAVQNDTEWEFEQMANIHERYVRNDVQFREEVVDQAPVGNESTEGSTVNTTRGEKKAAI